MKLECNTSFFHWMQYILQATKASSGNTTAIKNNYVFAYYVMVFIILLWDATYCMYHDNHLQWEVSTTNFHGRH